MSIGVIVLIFIASLPLFWVIGAFNRLAGLASRVRKAFGQIDRQLKRRYVLIASLLEATRDAIPADAPLIDAVKTARANASRINQTIASNPTAAAAAEMARVETALSHALRRLIAVCRSHPTLGTDPEVKRLIDELAESESRIAFACQGYNASATLYNSGLAEFPASAVAYVGRFRGAGLIPSTDEGS